MRLTILLLLIYCTTGLYAQKKVNPRKLIADFDAAVNELQLQHQGFYQYVSKQKVDADIAELRKDITEPMTKLEFYRIIRQLNTLMNEGHGSVDLPKWAKVKIGLTKSFFPLAVKFFNKELIIIQNFGENQPNLKKGMKLITINGEPVSVIMEKLLPLLSSDGFVELSKFEDVRGVSLSLLYRLVYGNVQTFKVEVMEFGGQNSHIVEIPAITFKTFKSKNAKFPPRYFAYTKFGFEQINDSIAYLSIPDFGDGVINYEQFYAESFKKIHAANIQHLIIDIQNNGGGEEGNENLLFSYLSKDRIQKYRRVTMLSKPYEKNKNGKGYIFDKWKWTGSIAERGAFTLFSDYYSELGYAVPNEDYIYQNKLYVLISGVTFSGGAEFASMIKMTDRGTFIGEETGGTYQGNVSGYTETIKLPNTKIKINIPTVHFQINVDPSTKGRGVMPDYIVPQTWADYEKVENAKLEFVKKLIME